jgi:hypothetical protein
MIIMCLSNVIMFIMGGCNFWQILSEFTADPIFFYPARPEYPEKVVCLSIQLILPDNFWDFAH